MSTGKSTPSSYDQIPAELRELPNWVVWREEKRRTKKGEVKKTKVPYNARTDRRAMSNNPATWSTFNAAVDALKRGYNGIGFCLSGNLIAADLDGCRADGVNEPWADEIVHELKSYTEITPSGIGLRVFVRGELPEGRREYDFPDRQHHGMALYEAGGARYVTVTGQQIGGNGVIAERTAELLKIHRRYFPPEQPKAKAKAEKDSDNQGSLSDDQLIEKALKAADGGKFARLWAGQTDGYASQSEADLALCTKLAFWTGKDAARMDALFRRSGLYREDKWEREDYREKTIAKAIAKTKDAYRAKTHRSASEAVIDLDQFEPSFQLLNGLAIWQKRIRFTAVERKGPMLIATTTDNIQIVWQTMVELNRFAASQAIICDAANILIPTPPHREIHTQWEQAVHLMLKLSEQDLRLKPVIEEEARDLLRLVWQAAGQPHALDNNDFIEFIRVVKRTRRNPKWGWEDPAAKSKPGPEPKPEWKPAPIPPCVFVFEQAAWAHVPSLRMWASIPAITNVAPPTGNLRNGLILLGFQYQENMSRGYDGDSETVCLWRGPLDVLED
jgi:hypothetical protein